jgi:hypothetical protein
MDDKEFKKFCNDLRCPLCGSQLDGNLNFKRADLYCVSDNQEFAISYFPEENCTNWKTFRLKFFPNEYLFEIRFSRDGAFKYSSVRCINMELRPGIAYNEAKRLLSADADISHLATIKDEKELIGKLKLYNTFS